MVVQPGDVISTPKGLVTHVGIVTDRGTVVHNSNAFGGVVETTVRDFSSDGDVRVERRGGASGRRAARKAMSKKGTRYNPLTWNCEHLVSWSFSGTKNSPQLVVAAVVGLGVCALGAALLFFASRPRR